MLHYKKPAFCLTAAALVACIVMGACFLTDPATSVDEQLQVFLDCAVAAHHQSPYSSEHYCCLDWQVLGKEHRGEETTLYLWVLYEEFINEDGLAVESAAHTPTAITVRKAQGNYELVEYWQPRDGSYYAKDIKEKFPVYLWGKALDPAGYIEEQSAKLEKMAEAHFAQAASADSVDTADESQAEEFYGRSGFFVHSAKLIRQYVFQESTAEIKPSFSLYEDGTFSFGFSLQSDYLAFGRYELEEGRLTLRTDDGKFIYCFDVEGDTMVFDADASSSELWMSDIRDGSVFQ